MPQQSRKYMRKYDSKDYTMLADLPACDCGYRWPKMLPVSWIVSRTHKPLETFIRCPQCLKGGLILKIHVISVHGYPLEEMEVQDGPN
jgi:hypothetical protein